MLNSFYSSPSPIPLQRLHVYDSLMMNAKRWKEAHHYHRQRQNVHYQSLNEPGIVCGLGVRIIEPPKEAAARFRDKRWLEIAPGIAIDLEGNPIIVDPTTDRTFRIATSPPITGSLTVYLVASYVEPQDSEKATKSELIREWFRLDEKTSPPTENEVELCRIKLEPPTVELQNPVDVLFPNANQLDFRYRHQAKARSQGVVRIATTVNAAYDNLSYLMQSVASLYPTLEGDTEIGIVSLYEKLPEYDLVFLTALQALNIDLQELKVLENYLQTGGIVFIELSHKDDDINYDILREGIEQLIQTHFKTKMQSFSELSQKHLLRTKPFLFAKLPQINRKFVQLWNAGGIIFVEGNLSAAWGGLNQDVALERNEIRTAHELGINILNFARQRRQMTELND
ncbi:MAG: DUF4159 domain-containing protein [Cyanobacteria bacterium J06635_10]